MDMVDIFYIFVSFTVHEFVSEFKGRIIWGITRDRLKGSNPWKLIFEIGRRRDEEIFRLVVLAVFMDRRQSFRGTRSFGAQDST